MTALPAHPVQHFRNPRCAAPDAAYGEAQRRILSLAAGEAAFRELSEWPDYAPTPLRELPGLAAAAGVADLWYKDEAGRFGLGSFKALGGAYAVLRVLQAQVRERLGREPLAYELAGGALRYVTRGTTVTCATDGNHGRAVAWGARLFNCGCVVYLHEHVSPGREAAIAQHGAEIVRVPGSYDDSLRACAADAEAQGRLVVSDTAWPGYEDVPRTVMEGYGVLGFEMLAQLPPEGRPTHVFVQGGVGGLAASVCAHLWEALGPQRPRFVVVEPDRADGLFQSARAGKPAQASGDLKTVMAGLACAGVSTLAWELLDAGVDAFLTIPDPAAEDTMRLLADGVAGDAPIVAGESAVAGLAGMLCALADPAARDALGLDAQSRVLVIGSEGATDPETYARIVGRSPEQVVAG